MSHSAHENRFNIVSFYGFEPTSPRFMPRHTKLRVAHSFAFGVYVVAADQLGSASNVGVSGNFSSRLKFLHHTIAMPPFRACRPIPSPRIPASRPSPPLRRSPARRRPSPANPCSLSHGGMTNPRRIRPSRHRRARLSTRGKGMWANSWTKSVRLGVRECRATRKSRSAGPST